MLIHDRVPSPHTEFQLYSLLCRGNMVKEKFKKLKRIHPKNLYLCGEEGITYEMVKRVENPKILIRDPVQSPHTEF